MKPSDPERRIRSKEGELRRTLLQTLFTLTLTNTARLGRACFFVFLYHSFITNPYFIHFWAFVNCRITANNRLFCSDCKVCFVRRDFSRLSSAAVCQVSDPLEESPKCSGQAQRQTQRTIAMTNNRWVTATNIRNRQKQSAGNPDNHPQSAITRKNSRTRISGSGQNYRQVQKRGGYAKKKVPLAS